MNTNYGVECAMSQIIDNLIENVSAKAANIKVVDITVGRFWTLVILEERSGLRGGLASTLDDEQDHHYGGGPPVNNAGELLEYPVVNLLNLMRSRRMMEASIGFATLNALLDVNMQQCREINALDILLSEGTGRNIAVVGHFPFVPRLRNVAKTLWVLERAPQGNDLPASQAVNVLPHADVVAISGTTLANKTFDDLISYCQPQACVVVLGATAPLSSVLLDAGVSVVAGTVIHNLELVKRGISQGATFRQIKGKRLLTLQKN
jgi:uncharacterized protein (DUF4213/DUF364 family)